jgi:hypothetical protein
VNWKKASEAAILYKAVAKTMKPGGDISGNFAQ